MHSDIEMAECRHHRPHERADLLRRGKPHRIGERDGADRHLLQNVHRLRHFVHTPRIAVRITERHADVGDHVESGLNRLLRDLLQHVGRLLDCLVLIALQKRLRHGIREPDRRHLLACERAFQSLVVHDDGDEFHIIRYRAQFAQHRFRVSHLRDRFRRHEAYGINALETRVNQGTQVVGLDVRRDLRRQSLPGVARTFDEFHVCNTPVRNSFTSGFRLAASSASAIASRVSIGSMILSIHNRAAP